METMQAAMTIKEIAGKFVGWRNSGDADRLRKELYSADIESVEDGNLTEIGQVRGMSGLKKKGEALSRHFEVHKIRASQPVIADHWFSVKFEIDVTDKESYERSTLSEIGVYKVEDGKIVKEHYFMW